MTEPLGLDTFQTQLEDWQKKATEYSTLAESANQKIEDLRQQYTNIEKTVTQKTSGMGAFGFNIMPILPGKEAVASAAKAKAANLLKDEITAAEMELEHSLYYSSVYSMLSNLSPGVETAGDIAIVEEAISKIAVPDTMSSTELEELQLNVSNALASLSGRKILPEMALDVETDIETEWAMPARKPTLVGLQRVTVDAIKQSLMAPKVPEQVMSDEEWQRYLYETGQVENLGDSLTLREMADELINMQAERDAMLKEFREGVAEMPIFDFWGMVREAIVTPGLAIADLAFEYSKRVSGPLSYYTWGNLYPEVQANYQKIRDTGVGAWEAAGQAWTLQETNGVGEWLLKFMVMEAITDPLTYAGWGLVTKLVKPIPIIGVRLAAINRGMAQILDLPFDGIKALAAKIPKTPAQRALNVQRTTSAIVDKGLKMYTKKASFRQITMEEFARFEETSIKYVQRHPMSDNWLAASGREFLKHNTLELDDVYKWADQVGSSLSRKEITKETVENVNTVFEDFFTSKILTKDMAMDRLLTVLHPSDIEIGRSMAGFLLEGRAKHILSLANKFKMAKSPYSAMQALSKRCYRIQLAAEKSTDYLSRMNQGRFSALLNGMPSDLTRVWSNTIDKLITKPFAEAYLTFGMYGPMNVIEDYWRSALGGVFPHRMTGERWELLHYGLNVDPDLSHTAITEQMGYIRAGVMTADSNNWVNVLGMLPLSAPTYAISGGKITPTKFAQVVQGVAVKTPGMIGMDLRRNFMGVKFLQILSDLGGDRVEALARTAREFTGTSSKTLNKQVEKYVQDAVMQGHPELLDGVKDVFTRKKIIRSEVNKTLMKYPDLPNSVRQHILKSFDDDTLFAQGTKSINKVNEDAYNILMNEYIHSPELATKEYENLAKVLTDMEITNPQEMAWMITQLEKMSEVYGAMPKQILGQASIVSRGLPFDKRNPMINKALDDMAQFRSKAGLSIDQVVNKVKTEMPKVSKSTTYTEASNRLFDLEVAKRVRLSELSSETDAWRRSFFASATKDDLKDPYFWDEFYMGLDSEIKKSNLAAIEFDTKIKLAREALDTAGGIKKPTIDPVVVKDGPISPNDVARLIGCRGDDMSRGLLNVLTMQGDKDMFTAYVMGYVRDGVDVGFTKESIGKVYDQIFYSLGVNPERASWVNTMQMELEGTRQELHNLYNAKKIPQSDIDAIGKYVGDTKASMEELIYQKGKKGILNTEYKDYDQLRQQAMDEAHKWYYKEYTDYSNANAVDSLMKSIYPYWTYESQRWFYIPRSFIRHPVVFTELGRYMNNSDYGYMHIPGTSIDINPFRGTVFGTLTTSLTRRDYPEYYDQIPFVGNLVEFNDFLSRYGFYPGQPFSGILSMIGGRQAQLGEILPATYKTTLDSMVAMFPKNQFVKFISEAVFNDRFRDYLTIKQIDKRGGNGSLISAKINEGKPLTDEEQAMWDSARSEASWYSAGFEQFGLFRMRPEEQNALYENASKAIEEITGYTPDQQDWLRRHNYNIWDLVGGLTPAETNILKELGYYEWAGSTRPLLPSSQQEVLDKLELAWDDVRSYSESLVQTKLDLQREFLSGMIGPSDYNDKLIGLYNKQQGYIVNKMETMLTEPLPSGLSDEDRVDFIKSHTLMSLEGRAQYNKENGIVSPVRSAFNELLDLYFSIELKETIDPETGERINDWDTFWAERDAIESAIPENYKQEWDDYISKNSTRIEELRREVSTKFFKKYNELYDTILGRYKPEEQALIKQFYFLEKTGTGLDERTAIQELGLVSQFQSKLTNARKALRYANPTLDAWLYYWGRTSSFQTPQAETLYRQIMLDTGRKA